MGTTAILSSLSGIFGAVGSVFTSFNNIKLEQLKVSELEAQAENEKDVAAKSIILKTLEIQQGKLEAEQAAQKQKSTIIGVALVLVSGLAGLVIVLFFKNKNAKKKI